MNFRKIVIGVEDALGCKNLGRVDTVVVEFSSM